MRQYRYTYPDKNEIYMLRRATTLRIILLKCLGYKSVAFAAPVADKADEEADFVCLSLQDLLLVAVGLVGAEPVVVEVVVPFPEVVVPFPEVEPPPLPTNAATGGPGNVYDEPALYTLGS